MPDAFEEAQELGERFPELAEYEVFEHVSYVCERSYYPDTIMGWAIMIAYRRTATDARVFLENIDADNIDIEQHRYRTP